MNFSYLKIEGFTVYGEYKIEDVDIDGKSWKAIETILKKYESKGLEITNVELTK